ncbi:MAG: hypothetical protein MZU91_08480 [Desulfosudis oleivorans]|nr:hypothetical protein [Desulfosudis oleivorans]
MDGLKIEPLPEALTGTDTAARSAIHDWAAIYSPLDERPLEGFGGVSEYGITVRWDKNFLTLIHLTLARRSTLAHVRRHPLRRHAVDGRCVGYWASTTWRSRPAPGKPTHCRHEEQPGCAASGRPADLLMALQLTGAFKRGAASPTSRCGMPGGGHRRRPDRHRHRHRGAGVLHQAGREDPAALRDAGGRARDAQGRASAAGGRTPEAAEDHVRHGLDVESKEVLDEFLAHGRLARAERERANKENRKPDFTALIQQWGGVTVAYRRKLSESPAYQRNHEEVIKAMEEGIYYADCMSPAAAALDEHAHVSALVCKRMKENAEGKLVESDEEVRMPARAIFVATGAKPNIAYFFEHRGTFELDGSHYKAHEVARRGGRGQQVLQDPRLRPVHLVQQGWQARQLRRRHPPDLRRQRGEGGGLRLPHLPQDHGGARRARHRGRATTWSTPRSARTCRTCSSRASIAVHALRERTPWSSIIHAPMAAKRFKPGQIYRLQNYERLSPVVDWHTPAERNHGDHRLEGGCRTRHRHADRAGARRRAPGWPRPSRPGEPIALMGPSGTAAHIPHNQTLLIVADRIGATGVRALGPALQGRRQQGAVLHLVPQPRRTVLPRRVRAGLRRDRVGEPGGRNPSAASAGPQLLRRRARCPQGLRQRQAQRIVPLRGHGPPVLHGRRLPGAAAARGAPQRAQGKIRQEPAGDRLGVRRHAVHAQGRVLAVPAMAGRPGHRPTHQGGVRLLLAGPAARHAGLRFAAGAAGAEPAGRAPQQFVARASFCDPQDCQGLTDPEGGALAAIIGVRWHGRSKD